MATSSIVLKSSAIITLIILFCVSSTTGTKLHIKVVQPSVATTTESPNLNPRPPPKNSQNQCVLFHHPYCSRFGYNHTISPNPWARNLTLENAEKEFNDFNDLLANNCSDQLGMFLCFTYFPLCYEVPQNGRKIVLPCKETCEYVHNSTCNNIILRTVGQWGNHLQCANFRTKKETENGNCAGGHEEGDNDGNKQGLTTTAAPNVTTDGIIDKTEGEGDTCKGKIL